MAQLDHTYFTQGPITIAQADQAAVQNNLAVFLVMHERDYWERLLGKALYAAYLQGIAVLPTPDSKWTILDAKMYKVSGAVKLSPAANFVYFYYQRDQVTQTTGTGEKIITSENAVNAGNAAKSKLAWNAMVRMGHEVVDFVKANLADYPQWVEPVYDGSTPEALQLYKDRMEILKTTILFF